MWAQSPPEDRHQRNLLAHQWEGSEELIVSLEEAPWMPSCHRSRAASATHQQQPLLLPAEVAVEPSSQERVRLIAGQGGPEKTCSGAKELRALKPF
ncbi:hypothetical protein NDU88_001188 [Pleurodeles waltl]|uniref:Uncharacterized protein n=1 Tax=Pleurodeles waltl TaxID=8319 RepID=A0AAV7R743_PLEWA|nr:hypothetical protein NDU88_001188 [Pleurodeles waltl]